MFRHGTKSYKNGQSKVVLGALLLLLLLLSSIAFFTISKGTNTAVASSEKSSYIVIEQSSRRILKGENVHQQLPMASTTKIMTALIVLEHASLDDVVTIPQEAVGIEGSSIYLKVGDKLSVRNLLYGLMLRSGNDSAVALAIHTAGSVEKFTKLMNNKVDQLGLKNTRFVNPHGLSAKGHYTSAYDLAIISSEAMLNPVFKEIVSTKLHVIKSENEQETRYFANKNRILYNYDGGNGIKTGYTTEAGRCLVASSERNGMQVIAVAINHYDYFDFCSKLMDYAYENYHMQKVIDKNKSYSEVKVKKGGKIKKVDLFPSKDCYYPVKKDDSEEIRVELSTVKQITAPHLKETPCGSIKIYVDNCLKFDEKLYTIYNIDKRFSITDLWSK